MTDLQCPAIVVLLEADTAEPAWLGRLPVADVLVATGHTDVGSVVDEVADRFRGETVVVVAPAAEVARALRGHGIDDPPPVVVGVDAEGWRVLEP